jgi:hypothetical protein
VTNDIDTLDSGRHNQAEVERVIGAVAALFTWLGWLAICPTLGFPSLGPAAMVNRAFFGSIQAAGRNPDFWIGWVIVVAGVLVAIVVFFVADLAHVLRAGIRTGVVYGVALWLFAGVVIMPLLAFVEAPRPLPASLDPMQPTLMMNSLGPLAALAALIAWVLFGAILGATGRVQR